MAKLGGPDVCSALQLLAGSLFYALGHPLAVSSLSYWIYAFKFSGLDYVCSAVVHV